MKKSIVDAPVKIMLKVITLKLFVLTSAEVESKHIQQAHPPRFFHLHWNQRNSKPRFRLIWLGIMENHLKEKCIGFITHCLKSVQVLSYFWSAFSCIRTKYGGLHIQSEYRKIRTRSNSVFGDLSRSNYQWSTVKW